ncbi:effector-associated domain EAD1-containing protein [Antarctobacter jejuensis]|uniref:effector-associated domain EAD1-containing protein n=1 Tax=Antarctobacter jejuensis TaxID=1439938 RepID=UPI003FD333C4
MPLGRDERKDLHRLLLDLYQSVNNLRLAVSIAGRNIEDVSTAGTRPEIFLEVIVNAYSQGWLEDLLEAIFDQQETGGHQVALDRLADLTNRIWPIGQQGDPHNHLLMTNLAFVNRNRLRETVAQMADEQGPSVVVLRGARLVGTSYCRQMITHVAREHEGIKALHLDLDLLGGDLSPETVMKSIALLARFDDPPTRNDLLRQDGRPDVQSAQLALALSTWFIGQATAYIEENDRAFWLVLDNSHRESVPPATADMIRRLVRLIGSGTTPRLAMFLLGSGDQMAQDGFHVQEVDVPPLGRPDIEDFLNKVKSAGGSMGGYADVPTAVEAITQNCDFANPEMSTLNSVTQQLTLLVRSL